MALEIHPGHAIPPATRARRLACLDGLRGALAFMVVVIHAAQTLRYPPPLQGWVSSLGDGGLAVALFFVLSGLVISNSLVSFRAQLGPFLVARAARLYPAYLFALALSLPLAIAGWGREPFWAHLLAHLAMAHGVFPNGVLQDVYLTILQPAWSLATEWQFYLVIGLLAAAGCLHRGWSTAVFMAMGLAGVWTGRDFSPAFLPNAAHLFALGIATSAVFLPAAPAARRGFGLAVIACLAVTLLRGATPRLLVPIGWCVIVATELDLWGTRPIGRVLRSRPLQWLGRVSYSLYLIHFPVLLLFAAAWKPSGTSPVVAHAAWVAAAFAVSLVTAALMQAWIEVPMNAAGHRLAKSLLRPGRPATA